MRNIGLFIVLLTSACLFSCSKVDISKDLKKDLVGKTWISTHTRDINGDLFENQAYSITSYYEQGFKLKSYGNYIPKYFDGSTAPGKGKWYLNDNETELIIENKYGAIYSYEIINVNSETLELFSPSGYLIFTAK